MENSNFDKRDTKIIFSRSIKAGKRIYYLDVKQSRNGEYFLAITESKKRVVGSDENAQLTYEKHKIFLYKEDFEKFMMGMNDVIAFINESNAANPTTESETAFESTDDVNDSQEEDGESADETFGINFSL